MPNLPLAAILAVSIKCLPRNKQGHEKLPVVSAGLPDTSARANEPGLVWFPD